MNRTRSLLIVCQFGGMHGWGHVVRSSALSEYAKSVGWRTELCTSSDPRALSSETRRAFTGVTMCEPLDLGGIVEGRNDLDVVFIDDMHQPDEYFDEARGLLSRCPTARIVAMDDLGTRRLGAVDLVVNTELGLTSGSYAAGRSLIGERYALIRSGFSRAAKASRSSASSPVPVLVMVGGTDPYGWTPKVLHTLRDFGGATFAPIVVSGDGANEKLVVNLLSQFPESEYETSLDSEALGQRILSCRFGIIGCGSSVYEFAALNRRFVGLSVADNQRNTAQKIRKEWGLPIIECCNSIRDFSPNLEEALQCLLEQTDGEGEARYSTVDFHGPRRVLGEIEKLGVGTSRSSLPL